MTHSSGQSKSKSKLSIKEFLAGLREPVRASFANKTFTVFGDVERVTLWKDGFFIGLIQKEGEKIFRLTVFVNRAIASKSDITFEENLQLLVTGTVTLMKTELQFTAAHCEDIGYGKLHKEIEKWKEEYQQLFKRPKKNIPLVCKDIGVISSKSVHGYFDFNAFLRYGRVYFKETKMQDEGAAEMISAAIREFNNKKLYPRLDCIVIVRGGGSFVDLFEFNMPILLKTIAVSAVPVISAVGNETDYTLCDLAADMRYPTPTYAATELTKKISDVRKNLITYREDLKKAFAGSIDYYQTNVDARTKDIRAVMNRIYTDIKKNLTAFPGQFFSAFDFRLRQAEQQISSEKKCIESTIVFHLRRYGDILLDLQNQLDRGLENARIRAAVRKINRRNIAVASAIIAVLVLVIVLMMLK